MASRSIEQLKSHFQQIALLSSTQATLEWDERTGLPPQGAEYRAEQITLLSGLIHSRRTDPRIGEWLEEAESGIENGKGSNPEAAAIRCWRRDYRRDTRLPQSLVEAIARATTLGQNAWSIARPKNDFASFAPHLKEILRLRREEASLLAQSEGPLYDALLDQYEEGVTSADLEETFGALKQPLATLVQEHWKGEDSTRKNWLSQPFSIEVQKEMSRWIGEKIGFDFSRGRLDITDHPFCTTLGPSDHRILTRYVADHFSSGFFGTLHEAGHGMYEQGLPIDWFGMPPGQPASLGIHESQSRLWENVVGRSLEFWTWCLPEMKRFFPQLMNGCPLAEFDRDINRVAPSLIRVDADEVTYNLHIIIRFELEKALISDDLRVDDLPEAWNGQYERTLGIRPNSDRDGLLQDVHWSAGLFGYFPTYTLGNIYAAQLFDAADKQISGLKEFISRGDFEPLLTWLRSKIHSHGRNFQPRALISNATGEPISSRPLIEYLTQKLK